jgi:hypothetical protein
MATAKRAFGNELVAHGFTKERAGDVDVAVGFNSTKGRDGDVVKVANGFTTKEKAGGVEVANGFITTKERAGDIVEVANGFITTKKEESSSDVEVVANGFTTWSSRRASGTCSTSWSPTWRRPGSCSLGVLASFLFLKLCHLFTILRNY